MGHPVHYLAFRSHYKAGLKRLTHPRNQQSVYSITLHFNKGQLTAVKLELPLTIFTCLYRGLIFLPIEVTYYFFKFCTNLLFDHELNAVSLAEPHGSENLYILENWAITSPYTARSSVRKTGIAMFNLTLPS